MIEFLTATRDLETIRLNYEAAFPDRGDTYSRFLKFDLISVNKNIRLYMLAMLEHDEIQRYYTIVWNDSSCLLTQKVQVAFDEVERLYGLLS